MNSATSPPSLEAIQSTNWEGCIPIVLTLSSTSLSTPSVPPPIHMLLSRHTYLHVGLEPAVRRLFLFAPTILSLGTGGKVQEEEEGDGVDDSLPNDGNKSEDKDIKAATASPIPTDKTTLEVPYPVCWFEDESSKTPLRWHLFAGVLYDMMATKIEKASATTTTSGQYLPWRIRLHFTSYPVLQILPLDPTLSVLKQVQGFYKNSIKQGLALQTGSSKAAMNLTKDSHESLWESIHTGKFRFHHQVSMTLDNKSASMLPVRLFVNDQPPVQRPWRMADLPANDTKSTLGSILAAWIPRYFIFAESGHIVEPQDGVLDWKVAGIQPALTTPLLDLWKALRHPDYFLYIIVHTKLSPTESLT